MAELLTRDIAMEYYRKASALPPNGRQDIGKRRELRMELQKRCEITELQAVNIINGYYIGDYVKLYEIKELERQLKEAANK